MKRFLSIIGCGFLTFSMLLFSGCGGDESSKEVEKSPKPIEIVKSGYGLTDLESPYILYAVEIKNPNESYALEFPTLSITSYDEDGNILSADEQVMNMLAPKESMVIASQADCQEQVPAKVEFKMKNLEKDFVKSNEKSASEGLSVLNCNAGQDMLGTTITGIVKNESKIDHDSVRLAAVFYDAEDNIIYSGMTFSDNIAAGSETPFEINTYGDVPVYDHFEVYVYAWY